ncbi:MAG: NAD-reducing hydrogenase HoxS subunit beta [Phycisphaerae bacterium]|nr:NAD-reducing hydrogenase HoxS subunit beta [Phycisphaerae bacterium]
MSKTMEIDVHHVTRVEGHGNIRVRASDGVVEECELQIVESPRFFESMVRGRMWFDIPHITCRICGICSIGHTTAACLAIENAFGLKLSPQDQLLRRLLFDGEILTSHILHVYFLAAPDLAGADSVIPLASSHPEVVKRALRMKRLANELCEILVGRHTHPVGMVPGGFVHVPKKEELVAVKAKLEGMKDDLLATVETIKALAGAIPAFERETEYVALVDKKDFPWFWGQVGSSDAPAVNWPNYRDIVHEKVVRHSTSKHVSNKRDSYQVGALARVNLNYNLLCDLAKQAGAAMGYAKAPVFNPYFINVAQVMETAHCWADAIATIDKLLAMDIKLSPPQVAPRAGVGVGVAEVPRGILFHEYEFDDKGVCQRANLVIPTGQNLANIDADMRALVPQIIGEPKDAIQLKLEMLVRAYDPCISCSVHLLDVDWV